MALTRLVVVSNRVTPLSGRKAASAGGLAVGLLSALQETGGIWFGWSGELHRHASHEPKLFRSGRITYALMDLAEEEFDGYYAGLANRTLWPLFHYRLDLAVYDHEWYAVYRRVNQRFAEALFPLLEEGDLVWVHDYHLIPIATELRRLGAKVRLGFFLHIPFPSPEVYLTLPWHRQLVVDLCAYDLVGFQTPTDLRQFREYIELELGGRSDGKGRVRVLGRRLRAVAVPIGIEPEDVTGMALSPDARRQAQRVAATLSGRHLVVGVDRLDYTKGIPERLRAFELLLRDYPAHRQRVTFMQISAPSREDVPEHMELRRSVELLSGHINGVYSEADWVPLRYINRGFTRRALMGFFRLGRIGLVTPLRDGMNLVALEYVAAQDPENPGVLVLSRFAGCAAHLDGALIVNPYDIHQVADSLHTGLTMSLEERTERWQRMMAAVREHDVRRWKQRFLEWLREADPGRRP